MMKKCCPCSCLSGFRAVFRPQHIRSLQTPRPPSTTAPGEDFGVPVLTVHDVDPCIEENGENHRTSRYELMNRRDDRARLIVRRGQEFYLHLSLSRDYISSIDGISIVFTLDGIERPQYGHGTLVATALLNPGEISEAAWQTTIDATGQKFLRIKVVPSANAIIGKWKMEIDTKNKETEGAVSYTMHHLFYLICNPWCEDDVVYLENEDERQEYVLAEDGLIWRGNRNRLRPTVWKYAQFERDILDSALHLMNQVGKVRVSGRNDPVVITRCLSAAVNSPDDNGAVMGNWSDDYEGGTPPTRWMGSQKILQEYYKTKKPVKYGQCWVFSGVLATVCRTLGIPCRVVTNYSSAHDTQSSLTVDYFVNAEGKIMEELNSDSIWNFHVWNEVWMKRLDLSPDCSGWQAIDATPQELSEGAYRCGPASVTAVKKGEVLRPYDNAFLFAEVNADKVFWRYNGPTQPLKLIRKDMYGIGQLISTKAVGKWTREDITHTYKYPESSDEERAAMLKALRQSESLFSRYYLNEEFNDIMFTFELRDDIIIGQPFSVVLLIKNRNSMMEYRVSVILRVETVMYTGRVGEPVKRLHVDRLVRPGVLEEIRMDVSWEEYGPRLLDQCAFNIACLATVKDTNFEYFAQDDFRVRKPDIKITLHSDAIVGQTLNASAKFRNPLPIPLKKGVFLIEGPGLDEQLKLKLSEPVEVDADAECTFSMIPKLEGRARIAAKFYSKELEDVDGHSNNFIVKSAKIIRDDLFGVPVLTIHDVDPCIKENGENHRTSKYELMTRRDDRARLVVRRGQAFYLHVSQSRHFCSFIDEMSIVFILDGIKRPQYRDGTMVATTLLHPGEISKTAWQANIDPIDHRLLRIKIVPPADAIIGKWKIKINTKYKPTEETASYTMDHPFYLIYNPWCKDDVHYLEGEDERQEYVLMEDGLIWLGNRKNKRRIKWKYAQFDQDILDIALYLMNQVCKVRVSDRNNTIVIIRCLSAAVNSNIDNGVVVGEWGGYYKAGTPPTWWTGSQKILQEYYKTKEPVKYGQCWVYAGVLTTICRTLGIPCRPVTNYLSAYDSDTDIESDTDTCIETDTKKSLTVDYFMNAKGQIKRKDFIWNFHVWNEVWMKRLFPDYSGWQVIDATPQELSEGSDRIGPTSVAAVKKGELVFPYDTAFLYYKTNADEVFWLYDGPAQPLKIIRTDRHSIGQLISTKAVGKWSREDITHTYKYPEGSDEERAATRKVLRQSKSLLNRYYLNEEFDDVMFTFKRDDIIIGQPFSVVLLVKNRSSIMEYRVFVLLRVEMVLYTGQVGKSTEKTYFGELARPGELLETRLDISWEKYSPRLLDQCNFINITFFTTVLDVDMKYNVQDDFNDSFIVKLEKSRSNFK